MRFWCLDVSSAIGISTAVEGGILPKCITGLLWLAWVASCFCLYNFACFSLSQVNISCYHLALPICASIRHTSQGWDVSESIHGHSIWHSWTTKEAKQVWVLLRAHFCVCDVAFFLVYHGSRFLSSCLTIITDLRLQEYHGIYVIAKQSMYIASWQSLKIQLYNIPCTLSCPLMLAVRFQVVVVVFTFKSLCTGSSVGEKCGQ